MRTKTGPGLNYTVNHRFFGGGSLQGYLPNPTTYDELVGMFGEPDGPGDKTLAEWTVIFHTSLGDVHATIYDYKNYGQDARDITSWHVGGNVSGVVDLCHRALAEYRAVHGVPTVSRRPLVF